VVSLLLSLHAAMITAITANTRAAKKVFSFGHCANEATATAAATSGR